MEKIKHLLMIGALVVTGGGIAGLLVFVPEWAVDAQSTQVNVYVSPPDLCPNILGVQNPVPAGMEKDTNGNCYTPSPPPTDMCPNIAGVQEAVPQGYYRAASGNCYRQTTPPQDVCPNITGTQTAVPAGMINDSNGACVPPPPDLCPNITGPQAAIPDGMERDATGACYTPSPLNTTPTTPPEADRPAAAIKPRIYNVPGFIKPLVEAMATAIPAPIRQAVKSVPPVVAKTFPYYIFVILMLVSARLMWQSVREAVAAKRLLIILQREKLIAEEKDNFIALSSHYLHTPLTVMRNSIDTIAALKEVPAESLQPLSEAVGRLKEKIDTVLMDIESNKALASIKPPQIPTAHMRMVTSIFFWLPILAAGVIALLSNFLLGVVGEVDLGITNLYGQTIVFGAAATMLYGTLRTHRLRAREQANNQRLIQHEKTIDIARNSFIQQSTTVLREGMQEVERSLGVIAAAPSARFFNDGYERFSGILTKFLLLSQIETGNGGGAMTTFNMRDAINNSLLQQQQQITQKQLIINNNIGDIDILQNNILFGFVLNSVIDNAIKFSREGGTIDISIEPQAHRMQVVITDNGIGVPEDKLPHLFKPFSRVGSALQFDYEGLGFSLFLDRIIMDYLGGDITADSESNKGTVVTVTA